MAQRSLPLALILSLASLGGCDGCKSSQKAGGGESAPSEKPADAPAAPPPKAVIEGVVRLAPGSELPSYPPQEMENKVLDHTGTAAPPTSCTPPKIVDSQPVRLGPEGGLSGIVLAASEFKQGRSRPPMTHEVTIEDCRLTPRVVVAVKGDHLRIKNAVDYPFMPALGLGGVARTLIPGQTLDEALDKAGVFTLRCGFTAPCGRTDVVVMLNPVNTVSDEHGKFRLEDVPADEPFVLSAWHPLFAESKQDVKVAPGEVKQVEFVLTPLPQAAAPAPTPAPSAKGVTGTPP